jgi:hypothetical protein
MPKVREFNHRGYLISCEPSLQSDGRFGAWFRIRDANGNVVWRQDYPSLKAFPSEDEAIEYARVQALRWLDDQRK